MKFDVKTQGKKMEVALEGRMDSATSGIHALISAIRSSFVVSLIKFDFIFSSGDNYCVISAPLLL